MSTTMNGVDVPAWVLDDREWASAVWLLTWSSKWPALAPFVNFDDHSIEFEDMCSGILSHGESIVVRAAWSLYNDGWCTSEGRQVGLGEMASCLGAEHRAAVLHAFAIRTGTASPSDQLVP